MNGGVEKQGWGTMRVVCMCLDSVFNCVLLVASNGQGFLVQKSTDQTSKWHTFSIVCKIQGQGWDQHQEWALEVQSRAARKSLTAPLYLKSNL